jgi:aspartate beta-hydroxylase
MPTPGRTDAVVAFLRERGADELPHGTGRTLLAHLRGCEAIAGRWDQPDWLRRAALLHSVYGTDTYSRRLIAHERRDEVRAVAGERAERIAFLFATAPRRAMFAGTHRWAPKAVADATREELDAVLLLHLINLAEQARAPDGSPAAWLVKLGELAELVADSDAVTLPPFVFMLVGLTEAAESAGRDAYRDGLAALGPDARRDRLALAAATCAVVGEPCLWLAHEASRRGEAATARAWAMTGEQRLRSLGTEWDKRLSFDAWLEIAAALRDGTDGHDGAPPATPRELYDAAVSRRSVAATPGASVGTDRFVRYMARLADAPEPGGRVLYPGLPSRPWCDSSANGLARALEASFEAIRGEVLALDPSRFAPESERIARSGDWDVVFFYERGRRHDGVCDACPETTRVIEGDGAMRTAAGLIYVSRMRPGTHIHAHRGPTNLRLRCHLGIAIPDGECALRVADETRRWREGGCLLFDDSFEHEAWNHTGEDRIVLIVDLWHPGLTNAEVHLLAGLQRHAAAYGRRLGRYWASNASARGER